MKKKSRAIGSDLARAARIPGVPDADIPELTAEMLDRAVYSVGDTVLPMPRKRGRPLGSGRKQAIKVRIDKDVLAHFRATGRGWQTRMNEVLRRGLRTLKPGAKRGERTKRTA